MKMVVIYRPRTTPPLEAMGGMFEGMRQWLDAHEGTFDNVYFFVGGGGFGVGDFDDSDEVMRMAAEHPFTVFSDVEIRPIVEAGAGLQALQEGIQRMAQQ